jgi:hypothetical protein
MKIQLTKANAQAGSVLLVSLIITAILGLTLASYLLMAQQQNQSVMRSQTWNSAIVMSEAGIEDGLALLNKFNSNFDTLTNWSTSSSIYNDNWTALGGNTYTVRRYLADGYYDVYVTGDQLRRLHAVDLQLRLQPQTILRHHRQPQPGFHRPANGQPPHHGQHPH